MDVRRENLRSLLNRHTPADDQERGHLESMRALLAGPSDPFARDHYAPGHFTASSFILSPDGSALLLIFHEKLRRWLQPGGHVEPSDASVLEAALREAREEVGLDGPELNGPGLLDVDVHEIPARKNAPAHRHFDVRFLFRAPTLAFTAASDAQAARWVGLGEIDETFSDRSVLRAVEKLRR